MQTSSERPRARMARFDASTGKRRGLLQGWRLLAAGLAVAVLAGSGIAVAAVASTAEAHNRSIDVTCQGITIHGDQYNTGTDGTKINTVTVTIAGQPATDNKSAVSPITFATGYDGFFAFPDPSQSYAYTAKIEGWDGYASEKNGNSLACAKPTVSITVPECTVAGALLDLTANLGSLDASHSYSITLASDAGGSSSGPNDLAAGFSAPTFAYVFPSVIPGHDYTVTVLDKTTNLTGSATTSWVGCPHDAGIDVSPCVCTVPDNGGDASLMVSLSGLSYGRTYRVDLVDATSNKVLSTQNVVADLTGAKSLDLPVAGGGTYKAVVTDLTPGSTVTKTSIAIHFLPCPKTPAKPIIDPAQCTSTNGVPNSSVTFSASSLVPGRDYQVTVVNGAGTNVYDSGAFTTAVSNWPVVNGGAGPQSITIQVPPGSYTVTVTDVSAGGAGYASSDTQVIGDCPKLPDLAFTPTQCTVPGGTASIATTVTNYVGGRDYNVTITGGPAPVTTKLTAPANGPWMLAPFTGLAANTQYVITVTDTVVPSVTAAGNVSLKPCPGTPAITVTATCNVLGASTATVSLDKLENGETYTVTVTNASTNKVVGTASTPGTNPAVTLQVMNIPNGNQYNVSVANANNTLTGSTSFYLKNCDLPTLAFTGANPVGPAVAGIGFLQFGLMFVGLGLVLKRRRRA